MERQIVRGPDEDLTKLYTEESDYVSGAIEGAEGFHAVERPES